MSSESDNIIPTFYEAAISSIPFSVKLELQLLEPLQNSDLLTGHWLCQANSFGPGYVQHQFQELADN